MTMPLSLTRRDFLFAATALPLVAGCASATARDSRWNIGCYTRPWDQHDYRVALDAIAEAGYRWAGIMTAKGKSAVLITADTAPEHAAEIGTQVRLRGLRTASVYGDYRATTAVADNVKALQRLIEHTIACGSSDLLLGGVGDEKLSAPYYQAVKEVCDLAAAKGVRLTIKPHGGQNATGPQCRRIIESVGHRSFGLWYDPGNIIYYSEGAVDPVEDARTVNGLVVGMSVKDCVLPRQVEITPGTGRVDFPKVVARLGEGGFRGGPCVVECLGRPDPQNVKAITEEARKTRLFVESLVKTV